MTAVAVAGAWNGLDRLEAIMTGKPMPDEEEEKGPLSPEEAQAMAEELAGQDVLGLPDLL